MNKKTRDKRSWLKGRRRARKLFYKKIIVSDWFCEEDWKVYARWLTGEFHR